MTTLRTPREARLVAFMSYAHHDDVAGQLTKLWENLRMELQSQTGEPIDIFKDDDAIGLGEQWRRRLDEGLAAATFLLPIVTPSFLKSAYCREELETFLKHEQAAGRDDLVLPIYYIDCSAELEPGADETAARTLRLILERQYFDWRELRHRRPSEAGVKRRLTSLAADVVAAVARTNRAVTVTPVAAPPAAEREVPLRESVRLLDALFDRDPVTSRTAARDVAERGAGGIPAVVERLQGLSEPTIFVLRDLLAAFPDVSGPLMVERIKAADRNWHAANQVPDCLSPAHKQVCADDLGATIAREGGEVDAVRKSIEALGFLGADDWGVEIAKLTRRIAHSSTYFYEKYHGYAVEALARIVTLTPLGVPHHERVSFAFDNLEPIVELVGARGWQGITYPNLLTIMSRARPQHSDRLLGRWLTSPILELRDLAACALGGMRLGRATIPLLERAADVREDEAVRRRAMFAVGAIGGADAVDGLTALAVSDPMADARDFALAYCVVDAGDDDQFSEVAGRVIAGDTSEKCWVYRAIGRRGDIRFADVVRRGLADDKTTVRADAALALARLAGKGEREALLRAHDEAATSREHVLTALALLMIGEPPQSDAELTKLRQILASESFLYRSPTQHDIVEVLSSCGHPRGSEIAAAWEPIYAAGSAY